MTVSKQPQSQSASEAPAPVPSAASRRWLEWALLAIAAAFYGLCFVHLRADFPNFSPWNDWSKMTDEGWYGGGAVHHFVQGHWFLPGSFNPAVAMPVWPLLLAAWFKVTGVSMVAARALDVLIYGLSLSLLYLALRRTAGGLVGSSAMVLMTVNPFCYAFDRLAVLEPVLVLWLMAGLWMADRTRAKDRGRQILLGVIVALLVLTKTTGLFLVPAIAYHLWAVNGWPRRGWLRPALVVGCTGLGFWIAYSWVIVRPHYLADFRLLFSINGDRVHLGIVAAEAWKVMSSGMWINRVLFPAALVALGWALGARRLLKVPLFGSAILAAAGYLMFMGLHTNVQPRYYLVIAPCVVIVLVLAVAELWRRQWDGLAMTATVLLAGTCVLMAVQTCRYVSHPEYSFAGAADDIAMKIRAQPGSSPVLLSNSGDDITLFTGIPAVAIEYSADGLDAVLERYRPGWVALWTGREDKWFAKLETRYRLTEVAHYRVFDDPERSRLVLYRMAELPSGAAGQGGGEVVEDQFPQHSAARLH